MEMAKGNMAAEKTKGLNRWCMRVTVESGDVTMESGSLLVRVKELVDGGGVTLLVGRVLGDTTNFNALEQLSRMCLKQRIWSGVVPAAMARGVKKLVVCVPRLSSAEQVANQVQRMATAIGMAMALNATRCDGGVPHFVVDTLVTAALMHDLEVAGCAAIGDLAEHQIVLSGDVFAGQITTMAMPRIEWHFDPYRQSCILEMTCIPAVMKLRTIAEDEEIDDESPDDEEERPSWTSTTRVRVLPRMSECWVISRSNQGGTHMDSVYGSNRSRNDEMQLPRTDEEFRSYWLHVHGINLPEFFGGYARVRFSSKSVLTYPACCVATEWTPMHKQTRIEGLDAVRGFAALMRRLFGEESVSITSPDDRQEKTVTLLPASALLKANSLNAPSHHDMPSRPVAPHLKRRMISRDRYTPI